MNASVSAQQDDNATEHLKENALSDKIFWHGYIPFYESFFAGRDFHSIAEFGVYKGRSIRWLLARFPSATIYGADILPLQAEWPVDRRFHFTCLDQACRDQIRQFLGQSRLDLIIEDGSHQPQHQINCLIEGLDALGSNGIYILEDVETSFPNHPWWNKKLHWWKRRERKILKEQQRVVSFGNALHLLLALDHYKRIHLPITDEIVSQIAKNSLLSHDQIKRIAAQIESIHLYRRTRLPDYCHDCGAKHFEYSKLKCACGQEIFGGNESMSFVIIRK
jgi:23S rRNA U2552 (ribose-2'-O)-methylase RlmE/FtsJ